MNAHIDISSTILETERLILRPWKQEDLDDFYAYASVDGVGQMAGWQPHESKEVSQSILNHFIEGKHTFALEFKDTHQVIGSLGIEETESFADAELEEKQGRMIGYVLSKNHWGKGLMPEAVARVIQYCFEEVKVDYLTVGHYSWNHQSQRVIEKSEFKYLKTIQSMTRMGNVEECRYYILKNEL